MAILILLLFSELTGRSWRRDKPPQPTQWSWLRQNTLLCTFCCNSALLPHIHLRKIIMFTIIIITFRRFGFVNLKRIARRDSRERWFINRFCRTCSRLAIVYSLLFRLWELLRDFPLIQAVSFGFGQTTPWARDCAGPWIIMNCGSLRVFVCNAKQPRFQPNKPKKSWLNWEGRRWTKSSVAV